MKLDKRIIILKLVGLIFCTVPVFAAIISFFPLWRDKGAESVLSGFSLLLLAIAAIPLYKFARRALRSASAHTMWFIAFLTFFFFSKIAYEMTVISFVGFIGNFTGALLFRRARTIALREGKVDKHDE